GRRRRTAVARARAERRARDPAHPLGPRRGRLPRRVGDDRTAVARRRLSPLHRSRLLVRRPGGKALMAAQLFQGARQTGWMIVRQGRNLMREPIWIALMVIQPLIWLLLYGQLFSRVGQLRGGASSYVEFLAPGIVCMNAFFGGSWSGMAMIADLNRHVIDRFLAAPASRFAIVFSQVVRAGITAVIQTLILLLVGLALGVRVHGGVLGWLVIFAASFLLASAFAGFSNGLALIFRRPESMI